MKIDQMHYNFKLQFQRVDSLDKIDFESYQIDEYLYKAIWLFLKERYGFDERIKKGFETDQSRITQLSSLHIKSPELQEPVIPINLGDGRYEVRLNSLGSNINGQYFRYLFFTSGWVKAKKSNCYKNIDIVPQRIDESKNTYTDSSWLWRRVTVNFGKSTYQHPHILPLSNEQDPDTTMDLEVDNRFNVDQLTSLYLDTNNRIGDEEFTIEQVFISYIKYPNRVFFGGYDHIDGMSNSTTDPIHCDIDEAYHDEIVRKAVYLAKVDLEDVTGVQIDGKVIIEDTIK